VKTLAIIPARLGATRLPRKPLRLLAGVPVILRVLQRVRALRAADAVVVATDSDEIAAIVGAAGGRAVMTYTDHLSGTDRVAEVARRIEFRGYDAIVNVQGDEPFVSSAAVKGALSQVTARGLPLGTAAVVARPEVLSSADVVKVVTDDADGAMYFSRAPIPYLRDDADVSERDARVLHHIGVYAYTPESLERWIALPPHPLERIERLEQLRPLAAGMRMGVAIIQGPLRAGIDTEADLERANREWQTSTVMDD
jgi:3-deoxy-manno-octulosonate cytidylyltransferase (CMP-KDO synthetase)